VAIGAIDAADKRVAFERIYATRFKVCMPLSQNRCAPSVQARVRTRGMLLRDMHCISGG
jgi:hypothetical protein